MNKIGVVAIAAVSLVACGAPPPNAPVGTSPPIATASTVTEAIPIPPAAPTVEIPEANVAIVDGQRVPFDGVSEGLVWPALDKALVSKKGTLSVVQIARSVPVQTLVRVVWTLRAADVRLQTLDESGTMRVVELKARREGRGPQEGAGPTCHLAVFLKPDGSLRIAAPGGAREVGGPKPAESLVATLDVERRACPLRYVAFGAVTNDVPWGPVFDVIVAVDRVKAAGAARYILGEAVRPPAK